MRSSFTQECFRPPLSQQLPPARSSLPQSVQRKCLESGARRSTPAHANENQMKRGIGRRNPRIHLAVETGEEGGGDSLQTNLDPPRWRLREGRKFIEMRVRWAPARGHVRERNLRRAHGALERGIPPPPLQHGVRDPTTAKSGRGPKAPPFAIPLNMGARTDGRKEQRSSVTPAPPRLRRQLEMGADRARAKARSWQPPECPVLPLG